MADKPKPKSVPRAKAKAPKVAGAKTAKSTESTSATANKSVKKAAKKTGKPAKGATGKPASPAAAKQAKPAAPAGESYFVFTEISPIEIRDTSPSGDTRFVEFSSFDDAREHLLEHLIELIEHHERVLHAVRRAATFSDYLEQHGQFRAP